MNTATSAVVEPDIYAALESELTGLWRELLETPEIGPADDFFDLGGHSLLAIEMCSRLRKKLNAPKLRVDLLENPTIEQLGDSIVRQLAAAV